MLKKTERIDFINIILLFVSCAVAFIIPFEMFLFAYAFLGPLHYLTEISWLHDKKYYAKDRRDILLLVVLTFALTVYNYPEMIGLERGDLPPLYSNRIIFICFGSALFLALIHNRILRIAGVLFVFLISALSDSYYIFFSIFLPTLIHVFLFTSIFMLYGALKSGSKMGILSVILHLCIPFILFYAFPGKIVFPASQYGIDAYQHFQSLHIHLLSILDTMPQNGQEAFHQIFESDLGIAIMRFIAFAYTYHYLNWFSKTEVIRWHKIPKSRLWIVIFAYIVSVALYAIDYSLGFKWLFMLSFMHVTLEFPLNYISFVGVINQLRGKKQLKTASS